MTPTENVNISYWPHVKYTLLSSVILCHVYIHSTVNSVINVTSVESILYFFLMVDLSAVYCFVRLHLSAVYCFVRLQLSAVYYYVRLHGTVSVSSDHVHGSVILLTMTVYRVRVKEDLPEISIQE